MYLHMAVIKVNCKHAFNCLALQDKGKYDCWMCMCLYVLCQRNGINLVRIRDWENDGGKRIEGYSCLSSLSFSTCQPALAVGAFREGLAWNCQCILSTSAFCLSSSSFLPVRPSHPHLSLSVFLQCKAQPESESPSTLPNTHKPTAYTHTPRLCERKHTYTHHRRVWLTASGSRLCVKMRGTPKKQHYWIWRSLCSRTANQITSKTILLSLSLFFPPSLFSCTCVNRAGEKEIPPHLFLSFSLSYGGINSEKMSLWYSTRTEWPDSSNCEYTSLLLSLLHRHTLQPTYKQHTNSLIVVNWWHLNL